jgi:hypothetical protein
MSLAEIAQVLTAIASLIAAIASLRNSRKIKEVHLATNSLVDRLVASTRLEAHAAGVKEGETHE